MFLFRIEYMKNYSSKPSTVCFFHHALINPCRSSGWFGYSRTRYCGKGADRF